MPKKKVSTDYFVFSKTQSKQMASVYTATISSLVGSLL